VRCETENIVPGLAGRAFACSPGLSSSSLRVAGAGAGRRVIDALQRVTHVRVCERLDKSPGLSQDQAGPATMPSYTPEWSVYRALRGADACGHSSRPDARALLSSCSGDSESKRDRVRISDGVMSWRDEMSGAGRANPGVFSCRTDKLDVKCCFGIPPGSTSAVGTMTDGGFATLRAGDCGVVEGLCGSPAASKRLADLGFVRGAEIKMIRPGSPCIVRIAGRCVGLGRGHQTVIQVSRG